MLFPKIANFGLSKKMHEDQNLITPQSNVGFKGTLRYMPPECFTTVKQTKASDVYSFALIVYELLTQKVPFQNMNEYQIYNELINGRYPKLIVHIEALYKDAGP